MLLFLISPKYKKAPHMGFDIVTTPMFQPHKGLRNNVMFTVSHLQVSAKVLGAMGKAGTAKRGLRDAPISCYLEAKNLL